MKLVIDFTLVYFLMMDKNYCSFYVIIKSRILGCHDLSFTSRNVFYLTNKLNNYLT